MNFSIMQRTESSEKNTTVDNQKKEQSLFSKILASQSKIKPHDSPFTKMLASQSKNKTNNSSFSKILAKQSKNHQINSCEEDQKDEKIKPDDMIMTLDE